MGRRKTRMKKFYLENAAKRKKEAELVSWDPIECMFTVDDTDDSAWSQSMINRGKIPTKCLKAGWVSHNDDHRPNLCISEGKACSFFVKKIFLPE